MHQHGANGEPTRLSTPQLYNLSEEPSEGFDIAKHHPEIVTALTTLRDQHLAPIAPVDFELEKLQMFRKKNGGGYGKGQSLTYKVK